jgi:zinc protease
VRAGGLVLLLHLGIAASGTAATLSGVERVVLENGLVVLLLREPGCGLVSVGMMYRVGAKNEAAGTTGLAHYAEHMNFRATRRFPGHEITESVTRRGGRWNGYTWIDQTFYQTTLSKEDLPLALDLEADRMDKALYDERDFAEERTSVVAELRSYDDPHSLLYDEVLLASFQVHPYRNNTIGFLTDVEAVGREAAFRFYRRFYRPRNAVLVVGGDFDREAALRAVEERFGPLPAGEEDAFVATVEPPQAGPRRVTVRKPGAYAEALLAFRAPALAEPDFPAMVLFDALLAGGKGLRLLADYEPPPGTPLERALVASGTARAAGSAFQASLHPYVYTVRATTPTADGLAAAEAALFAVLEEGAKRDWTEAELREARREVRRGLARDLDTLAGRVHQLAFFEVSGGHEHLQALEPRLEETGAEAVRRFASAWLSRDRSTVGWFVPTPEVPVFAAGHARPPVPALMVASAPGTGPGADLSPSHAASPTKARLPNGLTLHVRPRSSTGLLALRGRIDAGAIHEPRPGLAVVAARLFLRAARRAGGPPLALALDDDPGGSLHTRFLEFHGSGLGEDLPALARAVARGFAADPSRFDEALREAQERTRSAEGEASALLVARGRAELFPAASPLSRPPWGEAEAVSRVTAGEAEAFLRRFVTPARTELSVAGPVDPEEAKRLLEAAFAETSSSPVGRGTRREIALAPPRGPTTWSVARIARKDASQNTIHVVLPGDRSRSFDRPATSLLLYLLGETYYSGRLGRALVEPGLVYSVWTTLEEPAGVPGYLLVRTAASREDTPEVLGRIRAVLEGAARGAFTARELEEAKAYLRGKAARRLDGALSAAEVALEDERTRGPSPQEVTLEQLNDTARRLFARGSPLALVAGPGD